MPIYRYLFRCFAFLAKVNCHADRPRSPAQRRTEGSTCGEQLRVALAESPGAALIQISDDEGPVMPSVDGEATATDRGAATHPGGDLLNHLNNAEREEDGRRHLPVDADLIQTSGDDGSVMPVANDGGASHRRDGTQNLEEVLCHIAIAESLEYQGLPALVDLDGFQGFKLDDHDDEEVARLIALELGQSSNNPPPPAPDAHCSICMEDKFSFECMPIKGCSHAYCACCVSQYVASKVDANEAWVGCPDPNCETGFLEPEMCRLILPPTVFDRWGCRLCEEGILGSAKFYCPYGDCSALLIDDGGDAVDRSQCPHCTRMFCAQCRVPWHSGYSCKDYQTQWPDKKSRDLMKLAMKKRWQRCPSCGFFVERTSGCNYIKCRCSKTFCYRCAGPVDEKSHRCPKCNIYS